VGAERRVDVGAAALADHNQLSKHQDDQPDTHGLDVISPMVKPMRPGDAFT
jgi:hypothetical protein